MWRQTGPATVSFPPASMAPRSPPAKDSSARSRISPSSIILIVANIGGCSDLLPIDAQEDIHHGKCDALVTINERMLLHQTLHERSSFLNDCCVVPGLRPMERSLERTHVAHPRRTAVTLDQDGMKEECIRGRDVLPHSASER